MLLSAFVFSAFAASTSNVRATLDDGQVLLGEVRTRTLSLAMGAGEVSIPISDVGEVRPVRGDLQGAEGFVDVWLRNGTELRGRWTDPKLAMGIRVGGDEVVVDLPMNDLTRFQLQGGERWPAGAVYRLRTEWGDDILVDPAKTELVLQNHLGTFAPTLAECRSVAPVGDPTGPWRIELQTGTVLVGELQDDAVTVALPMGPKSITVPLESFVSLRVENWAAARSYVAAVPVAEQSETLSVAAGSARRPVTRDNPGLAATPASAGWFDNAALESTKRAANPDE